MDSTWGGAGATIVHPEVDSSSSGAAVVNIQRCVCFPFWPSQMLFETSWKCVCDKFVQGTAATNNCMYTARKAGSDVDVTYENAIGYYNFHGWAPTANGGTIGQDQALLYDAWAFHQSERATDVAV